MRALFRKISRQPLVAEVYVRRYFRQRSVEPEQLPAIMVKHIYTGAIGSIWGTLISGLFLIYFGNHIGMTKFEWGVLSCVGSWLLVAELISAAATQRMGHRKFVWFICALADRSLRFIGILAALAFWHYGWPNAGIVLIAAIGLASCLGAMAGPPWLSWLADIIPENTHGEFWGRRSAWVSVAVCLTVLPAGLLMDWAPEAWKTRITIGIFAVATLLGLADLVIHSTIPEPSMKRPEEEGFLKQLMEPVRDRGFRPLLIFNFCWNFAMMLGAALVMVYWLEEMGLKDNLTGGVLATTVAYLVAGIFTGKWTGTLVDRLGAKRVMFWGHLFWAIIPLAWLFVTRSTVLYWAGGVNLIAGVAVVAAVNANTKILTRYPPRDHRAMYIAVSDCAVYIATGLAALAAGLIAKYMIGAQWTVAGWGIGAYEVLAISSLVLRLFCVAFLMGPIREQPNGTTGSEV